MNVLLLACKHATQSRIQISGKVLRLSEIYGHFLGISCAVVVKRRTQLFDLKWMNQPSRQSYAPRLEPLVGSNHHLQVGLPFTVDWNKSGYGQGQARGYGHDFEGAMVTQNWLFSNNWLPNEKYTYWVFQRNILVHCRLGELVTGHCKMPVLGKSHIFTPTSENKSLETLL